MLPSLSRGMRVALVLALSAGYIGWHTHAAFAKAKNNNGDDDSASSGGGGDDDDDDDGGKGGKGGDDDGGDDDDDADKDQPPVTAGGLYTLKTYPQNEILRPLTITQGVTQLKLGLGTDISAKGAFDSFGVSLEGEYGVRDNFMIIGGITDAYNFKQYSIYAGFEASLIYDFLDIRVAADLHRNAFANLSNYCSPLISGDPSGPTFNNVGTPACQNSTAVIETLPDGTYGRAGTKFSIDFGMPLRYAFIPQVAMIVGQKIISIDFNGTNLDHKLVDVQPLLDNMGNPIMDNSGNPANSYVQENVPNSAKPDLDLSGGVAINPIPQLSVLVYAELKIADFDTSADNFQIPVTLQIEGSLSHQFDLGAQFTLNNVIPPDPISPIDQRYLTFYGTYRF
jgi:hypothetical protein